MGTLPELWMTTGPALQARITDALAGIGRQGEIAFEDPIDRDGDGGGGGADVAKAQLGVVQDIVIDAGRSSGC